MTMISGRTLAQGAGCESKMSLDFFKAAAVCHLSDKDFKSLGLSEGKNVLLKNEFGQVVLTAKVDAGLPESMVFIPMGPWANVIVGKETGGCGTPHFKGLEVEVAATNSPVLNIRELFSGMGT
ncbi:MAG TPA: molybdopterin dinucleotide binding domain-containing protein [Methanothrix sp.]|nr:molybdopterin dinucleotide binding domain-containing protein [Methanothrix sp.]